MKRTGLCRIPCRRALDPSQSHKSKTGPIKLWMNQIPTDSSSTTNSMNICVYVITLSQAKYNYNVK